MKYLLTLIITISTTCGLFAKPRTVFLDKELQEATLIEFVEIISYSDSAIIFRTIIGDRTITSKIGRGVIKAHQGDKFKTGYWPVIGEKVLVIVGQNDFISLFANKIGENYRFWSPYYTGSVALFCFKSPATKLPDQTGIKENLRGYETCWDGCILPSNKLNTFKKESEIYSGRAVMNKGKAAFIWDFADSEIYYLDSLTKWEEKYINKRITIEGKLVQVNEKSIIKNWKIIER
jgi:hypothetical protein